VKDPLRSDYDKLSVKILWYVDECQEFELLFSSPKPMAFQAFFGLPPIMLCLYLLLLKFHFDYGHFTFAQTIESSRALT
jgi:hypothetical protein